MAMTSRMKPESFLSINSYYQTHTFPSTKHTITKDLEWTTAVCMYCNQERVEVAFRKGRLSFLSLHSFHQELEEWNLPLDHS